jgi:hypothetical protein
VNSKRFGVYAGSFDLLTIGHPGVPPLSAMKAVDWLAQDRWDKLLQMDGYPAAVAGMV